MSLPKLLKSQATVRFQDCDPYGHLYNGKYIDYFMNAREDQLIEHYDLDIYHIGSAEGIGWVVAQNQIAYFQPAMLMEKVWITTKLIEFSGRSITVEFEMYNTDESVLKALMWSRFVHFEIKKRQSLVHSDKYTDLFSAVHHPIDESDFDSRVKAIRKPVKTS
jgi:acyl-CoA thioester hydrolase